MEYTRLGNTGLKVSKICLGCMSFGSSKFFEWALDEEPSIELIKKAYDLGINFFDTADVYSYGLSEKVLGKARKQHNIPRSNVVIATKVFNQVKGEDQPFSRDFVASPESVNARGLSRKHIFDAVEASLSRLGTDYIDLYQIHRWDNNTSIEETMEALNDLVRSGKVRYIGASSMYAWQFAKANHIAEKRGWAKFVSMQNLYNLLYREEEREMNPLCLDQGVGLIPWSPLAGGELARVSKTARGEKEPLGKTIYGVNQSEADEKIKERVNEIALKRGVPMGVVSTAWVLSKPVVSAPIIGATKEYQIEQAVQAVKFKLTEEECKYLEESYQPKAIVGNL